MNTRPALSAIALAGLTTTAHAQNGVGSILLTAAGPVPTPGEILTIGVLVDDDGISDGVFSFDIAVDFAPDVVYDIISAPTPNPAVFGFTGAVTPTGVQGLGGSTDIFGPTFDAPLNGIAVFTFQVIIHGVLPSGPGDIPGDLAFAQLTTSDGPGPNPALLTVDTGPIVLDPAEYDSIAFGGLGVPSVFLPTPSSAAPLALAALAAARRQRRRTPTS